MTIRFRIKVLPLQQWTVKRAFLLRLKKAFDRLGIEIPFPHLTVYPGQAKDGSAPPFFSSSSETEIGTGSNTIKLPRHSADDQPAFGESRFYYREERETIYREALETEHPEDYE